MKEREIETGKRKRDRYARQKKAGRKNVWGREKKEKINVSSLL